jgi:uncharacterized Zn-finger protein
MLLLIWKQDKIWLFLLILGQLSNHFNIHYKCQLLYNIMATLLESPFTVDFSCCGPFNHLSDIVVHTGERRDYCGSSGEPRQPHDAVKAEKSLSTSEHLKEHQQRPTGKITHGCSDCGKSYSRSHSLKLHQRIRTGDKPHCCSDCGKSFTQSTSLILHQRTHTGEKLSSCDQCGKGFTKLSNLISHQRTHTGEKSYSCTQCGKSFVQSDSTPENTHRRETF